MMETNWGSLQRIMEIAELRSKGIQDTHFLDWTFQIAEDNPYVQMAKRYVDQWEQAKAENLGLLFWGDVGTGKSFLAACIANALLSQGVPVLMTNFPRILTQMGDLQFISLPSANLSCLSLMIWALSAIPNMPWNRYMRLLMNATSPIFP